MNESKGIVARSAEASKISEMNVPLNGERMNEILRYMTVQVVAKEGIEKQMIHRFLQGCKVLRAVRRVRVKGIV